MHPINRSKIASLLFSVALLACSACAPDDGGLGNVRGKRLRGHGARANHRRGTDKGDILLFAISVSHCKNVKALFAELGVRYRYYDIDLLSDDEYYALEDSLPQSCRQVSAPPPLRHYAEHR